MDLFDLIVTYVPFLLFALIVGITLYECFPRTKSISGKHVVVTGGSSGIGKSIALSAARRGAHVTIIARDPKKLEDAVQEVSKAAVDSSQKINYLSLDLSHDYDKVFRSLLVLEKTMGPIYMLVNVAGGAVCGKLEDTSVDDIKNQINMNFLGTVYPTKALIARMKSRNEGIVVITGSVASLFGVFGLSIYSSTKFALRGFAEALRMEAKPYGISVTLSCPPDTDTPGFANEQKSKPMETRIISETAGLIHPDVVAEKTIKDALRGKFFSYIGLEGGAVATVCAGMSPPSSFTSLVVEVIFMGPIRLISAGLLLHFNSIVSKCLHDRNKNKKSE